MSRYFFTFALSSNPGIHFLSDRFLPAIAIFVVTDAHAWKEEVCNE